MLTAKILGIAGSQRHGNTDVLVKECLSAAAALPNIEVEYLSLADYKLEHCNACRLCYGDVKGATATNFCYEFDDDGNFLVSKVLEADGLILGSPVHDWDVSSPVKALMSRLNVCCEHVCTPVSGALRNKPIGAVVVGFNRRGGQESTAFSILRFGMGLGMIPVPAFPTEPDGLPQTGPFGALADVSDAKWWWSTTAVLPDSMRTSPPTSGIQNLKAARNLGRNVALVALIVKVGTDVLKKNGYPIPEMAGPKKWPLSRVKPGSYMEMLAKEGKITLVDI